MRTHLDRGWTVAFAGDGPRAAAGPRLLHLGRVRELCELPAVPEEARAVLLAVDHLGQGTPRC